jgi:hypothetical protein
MFGCAEESQTGNLGDSLAARILDESSKLFHQFIAIWEIFMRAKFLGCAVQGKIINTFSAHHFFTNVCCGPKVHKLYPFWGADKKLERVMILP